MVYHMVYSPIKRYKICLHINCLDLGDGAAEKKFYAQSMHHIQLNISSSLVYVLQSLCQQAHYLSQFLSQLKMFR